MKNIGFLVSGGGTNLQATIDAIKRKEITNGNISLVVSSKEGVKALERANQNNIENVVIEKENLNISQYSLKLLECFKNKNIDLIVLAGFMNIIGEELINEYKNKIINIHPSIIPFFCGKGYYGLKVHEAVLKSKAKITGATTHFVISAVDKGPIILRKEVYVKENDTPEILQKRVMQEAEWIILPESINLFCNDKLIVENNYVLKKQK